MRLDTIQEQPDLFDKQALEEYLIKMAMEGKFLTASGVFLKFEQGEPKKVTYHLAPYQKKSKRQVVDGWEFVTSCANLYLIYKAKEDSLEEFPISWEKEQQIFLKKYNVQRRSAIFNCSCLSIIVGIFIATYIYLCLLQENAVATIVCTETSYFVEFITILYANLTISQIRACERVKCLALGERVAKASKKIYILRALVYFFLFFLLFLLFYQSKSTWEKDLEKYKKELPMIRLEMIEDSSDFELEKDREYYYILVETSLSDTSFDKAVIVRGEGVEALFGLSGDRVIYYEYTGEKQITSFMEIIYQKVQAFY